MGMVSGRRILGIPISFKDEVIDKVIFSPATHGLDEKGYLVKDITNTKPVVRIKLFINY